MGEIADMMLDGDMCEQCGEYMGDGDGYARVCRGCKRANDKERDRKPKKNKWIKEMPQVRP